MAFTSPLPNVMKYNHDVARKSPIDFESSSTVDDQLFVTVQASVDIREGGFTGAKAVYVTQRSAEWAGMRIKSHPESSGKDPCLTDAIKKGLLAEHISIGHFGLINC